ncbi:hypothetical protein [Candidatus Trichorickettsia mobilis]|uniref:hypothetical protein n=1 Tax=Candidatus Trichorickettsia mobilis TaxID=1346319 RepID=UPI00292E0CA4|nr:hypothetical protein [Candidatus Trichorickettsia mobilis]
MSLNFLHDFQLKLYNALNDEQEIKQIVDKIYLSVVQDAKYPFLLINIIDANNLSKFDQQIYEIEFEICVFVRDKNQGNLTILASLINKGLNAINPGAIGYIIAGLRSTVVNFERSQDLLTTKLIMHYQALIKQEFDL